MHQRSSTNPPTVFAHALSIKNVDRGVAQNKPNEDFAIVDRDNDIFIVADGVTRTASKTGYPTPSPASIAAATVGRAVHSALSEAIHSLPPTQALNFAAVKANQAVAALNDRLFRGKVIDYEVNDLAGACAIFGFVTDRVFHYAFNGDCVGYLEREGTRQRFTPSQTARLAAWRSQATEIEKTQPWVRQHVRNSPSHPAAYGVFTGELGALAPTLLSVGRVDLRGANQIILTSDGFDILFESGREFSPILQREAATLAQELERSQNTRSDDKTIITIQILDP